MIATTTSAAAPKLRTSATSRVACVVQAARPQRLVGEWALGSGVRVLGGRARIGGLGCEGATPE